MDTSTPPPFTRTATELQSLKHELQRLKIHLIAHLRSKGIPIVVPPSSSIITKDHVTDPSAEETTSGKTVVMETKVDNSIEEDNEVETESNEKSALLATGIKTSNVMAMEPLSRSLQQSTSSSSSSSSYHSKNNVMSDQINLAGNNNSRTTSISLLSDHHQQQKQQHDENPSISCCTQCMQYLLPCLINILCCRGTRLHMNDNNSSSNSSSNSKNNSINN